LHKLICKLHELSTASIALPKKQIQNQVQTIGILVAEKAELQSKLTKTYRKCDKKQDECDELSGRLKASRLKIEQLKREKKSIETSNNPSLIKSNESFDRLNNELRSTRTI
jgi:chromosome segregation ATPase